MKKTLFLMLIFAAAQVFSQAIITKSAGWFESAYITWNPVPGADSYKVFYTGAGNTDKQIDTQLIRSYGNYFRADALGLAAGNYTMKVVPVTGGTEGAPAVSENITVMPHDRNGFAHQGGRIPGAYNLDGTLKANAVVLYITQNTKNTVSLNVTGATTNPCVGLQTILDGFKKGKDSRPLAVRLIGNITDPNYMLNGDVVVENNNNAAGAITIEGVGNDAVVNGWGVRIKNASNVEVRNLGFMLTDAAEGDNVGLQQGNDHVWVHHCDLFYGQPGGDADQIKGDGALDVKKSTWVTFSYNHFWDNGKANLLGLSEGTTAGLYVTYQHNWYDHSDSRHPRVRYYSAHIYNNYFDGNSKYGSGSTLGSSLFLEGNLFRNCKYPMLTSMQGTDVYGGSAGTFSSEDGGFIKEFNNQMSGQQRFVSYDPVNFPVEFDAYTASSRAEVIPNTIKSKKGANSYNNFDTDPALYVKNLTVQDPITARDNVMQYSGRVEGGDFKWTFNNAVDDASSSVNEALKAALLNYQSTLVFVQGENAVAPSSQTLAIPANNEQTVSAGSPIENMVFAWGGTAEDAIVTGLPASGIIFTKNISAKTITVSGTPTADVSFQITTSGGTGTPVSGSGSITVSSDTGTTGNMVQNFTTDGKNSTFYTITGNLSTSYGTVNYNALTLTQCLKMESSTNISFTTTNAATLTLVFNPSYTGSIKIDGTSYTMPSNGIITLNALPAGTHTILKGSGSSYLFWMSTEYNAVLGTNETANAQEIKVYPNPVTEILNISQGSDVKMIQIFGMNGNLVKQINDKTNTVDVKTLPAGVYIVKIYTQTGVVSKKIIKQ